MFFFVFKFYLLQKRCSLNVLNMILETPNIKVTTIIFESYEHQIINSAEADAAVDSTYVVVSIILIFLFGLGLCALEGSFINYNLAIGRFNSNFIYYKSVVL
jgi:hypothetical protein